MFLRVKHTWTCLLRVLATWDFHATVAKGKEEALEPSQQAGFQQPGFWITMLGFRIPLAGFRIPKPWIPDSTDQNYLDSGFRITLHGAKHHTKHVYFSFFHPLNVTGELEIGKFRMSSWMRTRWGELAMGRNLYHIQCCISHVYLFFW